MASRDLLDNVKVVQVVAPATITGDTTGSVIDTRGYESVMLEVQLGNATTLSTANSLAVKLLESATTGSTTFSAVAQANIRNGASTSSTDGTLILFNSTSYESAAYKYGYIGNTRYLRVDLDETGTVSAPAGVSAILGNPHNAPVA